MFSKLPCMLRAVFIVKGVTIIFDIFRIHEKNILKSLKRFVCILKIQNTTKVVLNLKEVL